MSALRLRSSTFTFVLILAGGPALVACSSGDSTGAGASSSSSSTTSTGGSSATGGGGAGGNGTAGGGGNGGSAPAITWEAGPSMAEARYEFTATRLKDGRVFVAGGKSATGAVLDSTEIFDAKKGTWSSGPKLGAPRSNHAAVLLNDGVVALIGGGSSDSQGLPSGQDTLASVDLFDPTAGSIADGPPLATARGFHQAVALGDGRVLVAGGTTTGKSDVLATEILDAAHTAWSDGGALTKGHSAFGMTLLTTGDVVLCGGISTTALEATAERFDATAKSWKPLPSMSIGRLFVSIAPLAKGGVLAAGGIGGSSTFLTTTETLAANANTWAPGPSFPAKGSDIVGGTGVSMIRLANGTVLAAGAYGGSAQLQLFGAGSFSGVFDEATRAWERVSQLDTPRGIGRIVELADHRVLLVGGIGVTNGATETTSITAAPIE